MLSPKPAPELRIRSGNAVDRGDRGVAVPAFEFDSSGRFIPNVDVHDGFGKGRSANY